MKSPPHLLVFSLAVLVYGATSFAGIRSPDGEVVFETCAALRSGGTFAVTSPEAAWKNFGLAPGIDGRQYGIFGPAQSLACVPFLAFADAIDGATRWYDRIQPQRSHTIGGGMRAVLTGAPLPAAPDPERVMHARRSLVAWMFNTIVAAFTVVLFARLAARFARRRATVLWMTAAYGLCSLIWPYAGTFFSEPLAILFVLLSLLGLLQSQPVRAGIFVGLACATHISSVLFLPFWAAIVYTASSSCSTSTSPSSSTSRFSSVVPRPLLLFLGATCAPLVLVAVLNFVHFGNPVQTGRTVGGVAATFGYGHFQFPGASLYGLLLSPGKGLLLFCPAVVFGFLGWRGFVTRHRHLALALAAAVAGRIVFMAARTDWHGGFSLGPRYLLMVVPLCLLPGVTWLDDILDQRRLRLFLTAVLFLVICATQQFYFVLGEIFSYLHFVKLEATASGLDVFADDKLYLSPRYSPLFGDLWDGFRGPYLLADSSLGNRMIWVSVSLLLTTFASLAYRATVRDPGH